MQKDIQRKDITGDENFGRNRGGSLLRGIICAAFDTTAAAAAAASTLAAFDTAAAAAAHRRRNLPVGGMSTRRICHGKSCKCLKRWDDSFDTAAAAHTQRQQRRRRDDNNRLGTPVVSSSSSHLPPSSCRRIFGYRSIPRFHIQRH